MTVDDRYDIRAQRLLASIEASGTKQHKRAMTLIDFGHPESIPENRESYNPIRRAASWVGCRWSARILDRAIKGI